MSNIFPLIVGLGPYFAAAIIFAAVLIIFTPWIFNNPDKWLFFVIFFLSVFAVNMGDAGSDGSLYRQVMWGGMYVASFILLMHAGNIRFSFPVEYKPISFLLLMLIIYLSVSIAWSSMLWISVKRLVQFFGVIVIGMLVARQAVQNKKELLDQIVIPLTIILISGLLFSVIVPSVGFSSDGALKAYSAHKNTWGQFSLLGCLVFIGMLFKKQRTQWSRSFYVFMLILSSISVVASKSTTSLLAFIVILFGWAVWSVIRRWKQGGGVIFLTLVILLLLSVQGYVVINGELPFQYIIDHVFSIFGKSQDLTGRMYLWELMHTEIMKHLWFGSGYGGFWNGFDGPSAMVISRLNWGPPTQAHSGYIDLVNETGLVGAILFFILLIKHLINILKLSKIRGADFILIHSAILISILIINYAETSFLKTSHLWWIVLVASIIEVNAMAYRRVDGDK